MTNQDLINHAEALLAWAKAPDGKKPKLEMIYRDNWQPIKNPDFNPSVYIEDNEVLQLRLAPSTIAPGHNPAKLTVDQIPEGRRCQSREEFDRVQSVISKTNLGWVKRKNSGLWKWDGESWDKSTLLLDGSDPEFTYSVPTDWIDPLLPKPKKLVRKPCGPEHFPFPTLVRRKSWKPEEYALVASAIDEGIVCSHARSKEFGSIGRRNYQELAIELTDPVLRSLDNGKTWLPCYVEV